MCRRVRTTIPTVQSQLKPYVPDYDLIKMKEESKKKQKALFDSRHRAHDLDPLSPGDVVWIHDHITSGTVVDHMKSQPQLAAFGETGVI